MRLPGDRSASLRAACTPGLGRPGEELDDENARLYRLTTPTSLDRPVGDDDGSELVDLLAADVPTPETVMVDREEEAGPARPAGRARRPGPLRRRAALRAHRPGASAATARWARSSASPPRPPAGWSSGPSTVRKRLARQRRLTHPAARWRLSAGVAPALCGSHWPPRPFPATMVHHDQRVVPPSWRLRPAAQQPAWPDDGALDRAHKHLQLAPPLVFAGGAGR